MSLPSPPAPPAPPAPPVAERGLDDYEAATLEAAEADPALDASAAAEALRETGASLAERIAALDAEYEDVRRHREALREELVNVQAHLLHVARRRGRLKRAAERLLREGAAPDTFRPERRQRREPPAGAAEGSLPSSCGLM